MKTPGKYYLIISGILFLVFGSFTGAALLFYVRTMVTSDPFEQFLMSLSIDVSWRTATFLAAVLCSLFIGFGATALVLCKRSDKAFIPLIQSVILLIFYYFCEAAIIGELRLSYLDFIISAACFLCIIGAIKNNAFANIMCLSRWIRNKISDSKY
jgi:hypothetical protein